MKYIITIDMDNAAFYLDDDNVRANKAEVKRILEELIERHLYADNMYDLTTLFDDAGNKVGEAVVKS